MRLCVRPLTRKASLQVQQPICVEGKLLLSSQEHVGAFTDEVGQEECQLLLGNLSTAVNGKIRAARNETKDKKKGETGCVLRISFKDAGDCREGTFTSS